MKSKRLHLIFSLFVLLLFNADFLAGQGVGINNSGLPANPSSGLDVDFPDKGVLVPRLTDSQRDSITNPAEGLLIFNTSTNCFNFLRTGIWFELCGSCIAPPAPAAGNSGPLCAGDTLFLTAASIPGAITYTWSGPNGFSSNLKDPYIASAVPANAGIYTVYASNLYCSGPTDTTIAMITAAPDATFTHNPLIGQPGLAVDFTPVTAGAAYQWTFQGGNPATSNLQNPSVLWSAIGLYEVTLTVSVNGCSSTFTDTLEIANCGWQGQTQTFNYTGGQQSWTVPAGVCVVNVDLYGAQGGNAGGRGARVQATFQVTSGAILYFNSGGQGSAPVAGWNGGGTGGYYGPSGGYYGGGGGGASDIRLNGTSLSDRIIVAGGGGGTGGRSNDNPLGGSGGYGGGPDGGNGQTLTQMCGIANGGYGAGQSGGGAGGIAEGCGCFYAGGNGVSGTGGDGAMGESTGVPGGGGAGGGGYYGGGGAGCSGCTGCGNADYSGAGGGGGSSWVTPVGSSNIVYIPDNRNGDGMIIINY